MGVIGKFFSGIFYSLPIRLLIHHVKNNQILLLFWVILLAIIDGQIGKFLGVQYLFLDPEYLDNVNFLSFMILGITLAGFTTAFHITSYIMDGHRFSFVGRIPSPFTTFSLNNSLVPTIFIIIFSVYVVDYQINLAQASLLSSLILIAGLLIGFVIMGVILYGYFMLTNKDIFKYVVCKLDEKLKRNVPATRANAMNKLKIAKEKQITVKSYLSVKLKPTKVTDKGFYDRATILQVFDQNHFNLVIIQIFLFALILIIGVFREYASFQIPAAASLLLLFTILLMIAGAFSYWFGGWSVTVSLAVLFFINIGVKSDFFSREYPVFGLEYSGDQPTYDLKSIHNSNNPKAYQEDTTTTLKMLRSWRAKFGKEENPKMIITCVSGGGKRASLWTLANLQLLDSISKNEFMNHNVLFTGASGGMIGASYYRELYLQDQLGNSVLPRSSIHTDNIAKDNLNAIIFNLLVNDLFIGNLKYEYLGLSYPKDRGYAFEQQLALNTDNLLDKPITSYHQYVRQAKIPMLVLAPTIMNDGRKLYISSQPVSYMSGSPDNQYSFGIDFLRFFEEQGSENLKFQSALRMNAAFPYITPNVSLPSNPTIKIMDAGVTDNFGINDAVRFLYTFRDWIATNTSEVVILSIRDSKRTQPIGKIENLSLIDQMFNPISSIYGNFENLQNHQNDDKIKHARTWFKGNISEISLEYDPEENQLARNRASLNWRLTKNEKESILENVTSASNLSKVQQIVEMISE